MNHLDRHPPKPSQPSTSLHTNRGVRKSASTASKQPKRKKTTRKMKTEEADKQVFKTEEAGKHVSTV
jgi:hypothetical protein